MDRDELLIERLITGELSAGERAVLDKRARQDPALHERILGEEKLTEDLTMLAARHAPDDLLDALMASIEREESRSVRGMIARALRWRFELPVPAWGFAAVALVALGYGLGSASGPAVTGGDSDPGPALAAAPAGGAANASSAAAQAPAPVRGTDAEPGEQALTAAAGCTEHPVLVRFVYASSDATTVGIAGDFNGWEPSPMTRVEGDAAWTATVNIASGTHEYVFVVDGERFVPDPLAGRYRDDGFGNRNALIELAQATDL